MRETNLVKRYWDVFEEICAISKKYLAVLLDDDSRKLKFTHTLIRRNRSLAKELSELSFQLGLGRLSQREITVFLNNVFDRRTRRVYRKIAKRHKRNPISVIELHEEAMRQIEKSQKRRKKRQDAPVA